jgi:hypothetical protein
VERRPAERTNTIREWLFTRIESERANVFAVLDGARDAEMCRRLYRSAIEFESLYSGPLIPALRQVSPHLAHLGIEDEFTSYLLDQGWGRSWGIYVTSRADFAGVRRHLRTILRVRDEGGRKFLFRFYDPRVLRVFLPTCDQGQLKQVFGPLLRFDLEAPDSDKLVRFRTENRQGTTVLRSWTYDLHSAA